MVTLKNETMQSAAFYLQSKINRQLYPKSKYPLTHLLDQLSFEDFVSKQPTYVKHFKYTLIVLFVFTLLTTVFFQVHIYVFNSLFGPFHLNANEFVQHVKQFDKGQSWFYRIEYVQIEIGENNIQNPENSQSTIRKYSDPYTRRHHIATYKKMKQPNIYVKLPTTSQTNFHAQHRFHFPSYSIKTLKCIVKYLEQNSHIENQFFVEKSEYIKFINSEYAKNSSQFNKLILTKCGILIGYLYRPQFDKAFIPTREHNFYVNDIAFDATKQYCSYIPLIISMLIFSWLLSKSLFYLSIYLFNQIRKKLHFKIGLFSFPLNLPKNVVDELWLLNFEGQPHEQLRQLDEHLQQTSYQMEQNSFIIENDYQQLCVVLLHDKSGGNYHQLPFLICPVTDIKSIHYAGIVYGKDSSTIPWPFTINENDDHSDWLHAQLMDLSQHYRNIYEHRLRHENERSMSNNFEGVRQRRTNEHGNTNEDKQFDKCVLEEKNIQRLKLERRSILEQLRGMATPASPEFIAEFRLERNLEKHSVDSRMEEQQIACPICYQDFCLNDIYRIWPCPSNVPHRFHDECMLDWLRIRNTCPICQHPVDSAPRDNQIYLRFFNGLLF